jgi:tetratricopeptide (TPR) repeat protein
METFQSFKFSAAQPRAPRRSVFGDEEPDPAVPSDRIQPYVDELQASFGPQLPSRSSYVFQTSPQRAFVPDAHPRKARVSQEAGDLAAQAGDWSAALRRWEEALAGNPAPERSARLRESRAQVLLESGQTWAALGEATRAAELDPSFAAAELTKGRCQLNFGEPELAAASLERAIKLDAGGPVAAAAAEDLATARALMAQRARQRDVQGGARVNTC